jgi:MFS family permease
MNRWPRNLVAVLLAGVFQAAAYGIYETSLPLYLEHMGVSFLSMGIIFGLSQTGIVVVRYLVGYQSDLHGRKPFFVWSLVLSGISAAVIPAWPRPGVILVVRTVREVAGNVREIMRSIVVFEHSGARFVSWIGRVVGSEFFFMAVGAVAAGAIITGLGYEWTFLISGALSLVAGLGVARFFHEEPGERKPPVRKVSMIREMLALDLPPNLWIVTASSFIFNIGLSSSHSFYLLLFWKDKFALSVVALGTIQMLHRFALGIPMVFAGTLIDRPFFARHYKALYFASMTAQGLSIAASAAIPNPYIAVGIFLLHDVLGATFWSPIHAHFVQDNARPAQRGRDVALASGLGSLGLVFGPLLAGLLIDRFGWRNGPYLASGIITVLAAFLILRLKTGGPPDGLASTPPEVVI